MDTPVFQPSRPRRGSTAVLAMLFLILFAALALGFFAATQTSVQVARADVQSAESMVAAESGMAFMRYQLARLRVPANTSPGLMLKAVADRLAANLDGTANLGGATVAYDGTTVRVPGGAADASIPVNATGGRFAATVTYDNGRFVVSVTGRHTDSAIARTIRIRFDASSRTGLFDYAIASRGPISTGGSSHVYGSPVKTAATMLSTDLTSETPIALGGKEFGGDVSVVNPDADVEVSGSVGGSTDVADILANHVHKGVAEPEFPTLDPGVFTTFVTLPYTDPAVQTSAGPSDVDGALATVRTWTQATWQALNVAAEEHFVAAKDDDDLGAGNGNGNGNAGGNGNGGGGNGGGGGGTTYTNCYVPANANPSFTSKDVIQGVLYIKAPNNVKFAGGCTIRGVIVVENKPDCTPDQTVLDFRGTVDAYGVETLDPAKFPVLRKLTGTFILAQNATVSFGGNFGTVVGGSIIADAVDFGGSAGGSIRGSIIGMNKGYPLSFKNSNSSPLVFLGTAKDNPPAGAGFTRYLRADPTTYLEIEQ
ncbi:MAG TPA: hypothetical protein VK986_17205 [Tepidisphaeraceae bacterium]|nr:hypothetical protein [Tepidisphaeraceae bacterium]